jgi:glycosyltransferase involved in cell wall biosynthesis
MLSVLLATRNRSEILHDVLEAFCHLREPSSGWRLIVVDNGSTDRTARVIGAFSDRLPLHSLCEPRPGKNHALNAGLSLVAGDLVVFTDDDVFPKTDWLVRLRKAADSQPLYSLFGGVVEPRWQEPPPQWVHWSELGAAYAATSSSAKEGPITPSQFSAAIIGGNMAIRSSIFDSGVRFDCSIGPSGTSYAMGSETEIILRLSRQGHRAYHVQDAVVEHLIRKEQLDKSWVLQRAIRFGRGSHRLSPDLKPWMGIPRHLFRDIPKQGFLMVAAWLSFRREALFHAQWFFNVNLGKAIEARIMAWECRVQSESAKRNESTYTLPPVR